MVDALHRSFLMLWLTLLSVALSACTIQLAPAYDDALASGLADAHTSTLTLFAGVEDGSPATEFADYARDYAMVIGQFDALRQRAEARDISPLASRLTRLGIVQSLCGRGAEAERCVNASPASITQVLRQLRDMRRQHRTSGLTRDDIQLYRDSYDPAIRQALTVENALRR
jgi:hypothetical protein